MKGILIDKKGIIYELYSVYCLETVVKFLTWTGDIRYYDSEVSKIKRTSNSGVNAQHLSDLSKIIIFWNL